MIVPNFVSKLRRKETVVLPSKKLGPLNPATAVDDGRPSPTEYQAPVEYGNFLKK